MSFYRDTNGRVNTMNICMKVILVFSSILLGKTAYAGCTASTGNASFGVMNSFDIQNTAQIASGSSGFACTGNALSLLSTNTITATIVSSAASNSLSNRNTSAKIPYSLCKDSACTQTYQTNDSITWSSTTLLGILGLFSSSDGTLPLYFKTSTGANVPAGTYTDTITLNWNWRLCIAGLLGLCAYETGSLTTLVNVTLIVSNACAIDSAPDIDFGTAAFPSNFITIVGQLQTRCTKNATYTINLTSSNGEENNYRRMSTMANGTIHYLKYQLLRSNEIWTSINDYSTSGTGDMQTLIYNAVIDKTQQNQVEGQYNDTVLMTVTY